MRFHTGEKAFQSNVCDQRFSQSNTLKAYTQVHTAERPYRCSICNKTFPHSVQRSIRQITPDSFIRAVQGLIIHEMT